MSFIVLVFLELNINFRGHIRQLLSRSKKFKKANFLIEDLDVSLERERIDNLIKANDFDQVNRDYALVVQNLR